MRNSSRTFVDTPSIRHAPHIKLKGYMFMEGPLIHGSSGRSCCAGSGRTWCCGTHQPWLWWSHCGTSSNSGWWCRTRRSRSCSLHWRGELHRKPIALQSAGSRARTHEAEKEEHEDGGHEYEHQREDRQHLPPGFVTTKKTEAKQARTLAQLLRLLQKAHAQHQIGVKQKPRRKIRAAQKTWLASGSLSTSGSRTIVARTTPSPGLTTNCREQNTHPCVTDRH